MRALEALLLTTLAVACVALLFPPRARYLRLGLLPACAVAAALLQLVLEGYRWQMTPAYLLALALFAAAVPAALRTTRSAEDVRPPDRKWPRLVGAGLALLLLPAAAAPPILFPSLVLPDPTGPHAVGLLDRVLVDTRRPETFTSDPLDRRSLSVRVWYPAEPPWHRRPVRYGEQAREIGRVLTRGTPLPSFLLDDRALVDSHSYRDADVARRPRRFPLLVFSHAYWAGLSQSWVLMEELASHGYVVASVAHAHETPYSMDREGRIVAHDPMNPEFRLRGEERARALEVESRIVQTPDPAEANRLLVELARLRPRTLESLRIWTEDVRFVMDEMERWNRTGVFEDRLDTSNIGVLGHSFGGAAAGQVCLEDARCKAGCNLDGLQIGWTSETTLARPFLFAHHDHPTARNKTPNRPFFERSTGDAYLLWIRGTRHLDFSDLALYGRGSLLRWTGALGTLDGDRALRIQSAYLLAFFEKYLRQVDDGLLDGPSPDYPEVEFLARSGA